MFNLKKLLGLEGYISEFTKFLNEFDKTHPKLSESQRKEKEKYQRIYQLRDYPKQQDTKETFWDNF